MTRAAAWIGTVTGVVFLLVHLLGLLELGDRVPWVVGVVAGAAVVLGSILTLRGSRGGQVVMTGLGLLLLTLFLAAYFRTYRLWPTLVLVILATLTFGLGLLGLILDRYRAPGADRGL
jgi:uncharacterized membrane protein (UPF0136 family)